jgi:hypothetical protein
LTYRDKVLVTALDGEHLVLERGVGRLEVTILCVRVTDDV